MRDIEGRLVAQKLEQTNEIKRLIGERLRLEEQRSALEKKQTDAKNEKDKADTAHTTAKQVVC